MRRSVAPQPASPFPDADGQPQKERDWLVTVPTPDGAVIGFVVVAPQAQFDRFSPTFEHLGRYDLAARQARQTLELFPDALQGWYVLGQCELARHRFPEALAFFQKSASISQDPITLSYVGHTYARAGNRAEAEKLLDALLSKAQDHYVIPRSLLWIYIGLGDLDRAFDLIEERFERRDGFLWWLRSVPWFDPLRSDPRFSALVQRMGFPAG